MNRAYPSEEEPRLYSLLHVKSVDSEKRVITGIATTPEPDRMGDIVVPTGVKFADSMPLLLHHDKERPVGRVSFQKPTPKGINFEASLPFIAEPGVLKDRVDEAWSSVKAGLITGVSIGFRVIDDAIEQLKSGGLKFLKTEVFELSLVTIPANASATILTVKSLDQAASGRHTSGVTDTSPVRARKDAPVMTIPEQITQFSNLRAAKSARMNELMNGAAKEGATLDEAQSQEYDGLVSEVKSIDTHLTRLKSQESLNIEAATAITNTTSSVSASELRGGNTSTASRITVTPQLPKGTEYIRSICALAHCKGNRWEAAEYARQRWGSTTPAVSEFLKSAITAGSTTDSTFAAPLAVTTPLSNEFIELLRPKTLLGRIPNLRMVPFNISVPSQTAGGTYAWVGQGKVKPLTNMATATVTLLHNKIAGIIPLTEELVKLSSPSAEELVRNEMIAGIVKFMDEQFIDPTVAASGTVSPASITNGTSAITSAGTSNDNAKTDLKALVSAFVTANLSTANAVFVMSEANVFALAMAVNPLGAPLFNGVTPQGGSLWGIPIVATQSAGTTIALIDAQGILVADDGGVSIDVSREASVQMDSAPDDPPTASTVFVSAFQQNLVLLRAERFVTWKRARTASVKYVAATYV